VIRAFIAADLSPEIIDKICLTVEGLKPRIGAIRWLPKTNLHLTIKFLGDIESSQVESIGKALQVELKLFPRCTISAKGLGVFPDLRRPKIFWVGLIGDELTTLAAKVESTLLPLGFAPEQRAFTPHLTIGRWRQSDRPAKTLQQELEKWRNFEFGTCALEQIILFESLLKPEGATYYKLATVPLATV
jgi:RNA 2',3'-cyclic 3'-phosphodiesterase